ncbi:MAG: adenine nucleotide alpha hydrolase family protein [Bacteroidales bacterium]|nr:adenine nucleotide alpha hydrolase family protein [Bacteroidales bacterium]
MNEEERIQRRFNKACVQYGLLQDGDRILVALSGGKDSLELCRLLARRSRIFKPSFSVEAAHVVMDNIPYETDRSYLQSFCDDLKVPLHILHSGFDESTDRRKTRCFLCSWNRRKTLFSFAVEHGFNKLALGHHQDDFLTTWLMNITYEGNASSMRPLMQMEHYPLQIIRPLCLVQEEWIRNVAEEQGFAKQKVPCPYEEATRRKDMNDILLQLEQLNPEARYSMWKAIYSKRPPKAPSNSPKGEDSYPIGG